jgi:hypothetical protein
MRTRLLIAGALCAATAVGAVSIAFSQAPDPSSDATRPVDAASQAVTAKFGILRGPAERSPGLSGSESGQLMEANPALARYAATSGSGVRYFLVPAQSGVCLATDQAGVKSCLTTTGSEPVAFFGVSICGREVPTGKIVVAGVFSDGATRMDLTSASEPIASADVVNNVAVVEIDKASAKSIDGVRWQGAGNSGERVGPLLPAEADGTCTSLAG